MTSRRARYDSRYGSRYDSSVRAARSTAAGGHGFSERAVAMPSEPSPPGAPEGGTVRDRRTTTPNARLKALVRDHARALARQLVRLGVSLADVDDAVQDVLLVVSAHLAELPPSVERAFLFATAARVASNARRGMRRRARAHHELEVVAIDPPPPADARIDELENHRLLDEVLETLPSDSRLVFLLAELHDLPVARIAERLRLPGGTVASRLRRARRSFGQWKARASAAAQFDEERPRGGGGASASAALARSPGDRPEIVSWWVSRGEVDALSALLGVYRRSHPNDGVVSLPVRGGPLRAQEQLRTRLRLGLPPPDTFQVNGGSDLASWVRRSSSRDRLEPLDGLFASEGWRRAFAPELLDLVSHDGRAYSVPLDIHRTNLLFYNRPLFAAHGLRPPATLDELYAIAAELRGRGVVPFALGHREGWSLRILAFETMFVALVGGAAYFDVFSGRRPLDEADLRATLSHVGRVLELANADAGKLAWHEAVERVRSGEAAMTFMGDWARGYLRSTGAPYERDVGEVESPGSGGAFVFATDTFGLPRRAVHRAGAIELLKVIGSREGQDAFNPIKGSIPARVDADLSRYDASSRAAARVFRTSARYPVLASLAPASLTREIDAALLEFARTRNAEVVIETLRMGLRGC
jgi:glucose/mannose transport system substrate-binding protein